MKDLFIWFICVAIGFMLAIIIVGMLLPQSDNTDYKKKCEDEGGIWTEVVHNRDLSYCTYFNNGG